MEDHRIARIEILLQQKRFEEAEKILKELLISDSNNIQYLSLLAEVNLQQDKFEVANSIIDNAIGLSPDSPFLFYIKARIYLHQEMLTEAEQYLQEAIKLDPFDADYFALLANVKLSRKNYQGALELATKALEMDSENILALNTRSTALLKLDKKEESFSTIEGALREDPTNSFTHANYGWGLLEKGDHKKALEHFKEALKNNPTNTFAQAGMLEAIKASNPVYRLFLRYSFWMSNLTAKYQWGVIIGFYLGSKFLRYLASSIPVLNPYLVPLTMVLALIAFSTWVIPPISNLFLRFNKYGQLLLDKKEKMSSNFVAISLMIFVVGGILYLLLKEEKYLAITAFGFAMMVPLGVMFSPTKYKYALLIYTSAMAILGLSAIATSFSTGELMNGLSTLFLLSFIAFQWVANFLLINESNR